MKQNKGGNVRSGSHEDTDTQPLIMVNDDDDGADDDDDDDDDEEDDHGGGDGADAFF